METLDVEDVHVCKTKNLKVVHFHGFVGRGAHLTSRFLCRQSPVQSYFQTIIHRQGFSIRPPTNYIPKLKRIFDVYCFCIFSIYDIDIKLLINSDYIN